MKKLFIIICVITTCGVLAADEIPAQFRPVADTFVLNPGPGNVNHVNAAMYNYGGAGSRCVAFATAYAYQEADGIVIIDDEPKGEFISLLKFNFGSLAGQSVTNIALSLYISNGNQGSYGIFNYIGSPGDFDFAWISDYWVQGTGAPHETPSNSLNGISYNELQRMLEDTPSRWTDTFYYSAANTYGSPMWYAYTFDLNDGYYADLLAAISRGETVTFILKASEGSNVSFNFSAYVQNTAGNVNLRPEGPILDVNTDAESAGTPLISDCYTLVNVSGRASVGGLAGYNAGNIRSCYAAGHITCDACDPNNHIGGRFGQNVCAVQNCFWDIQTSGLPATSDTNGLSTVNMMQQSSFASWDFSTTDGNEAEWEMLRPGEDYPRLAWQQEIAGDIAGLYGVDMADLVKLTDYWLRTGCPNGCGNADINADGIVNMADFAILAQHWREDK
jgi:hypothetical protein